MFTNLDSGLKKPKEAIIYTIKVATQCSSIIPCNLENKIMLEVIMLYVYLEAVILP